MLRDLLDGFAPHWHEDDNAGLTLARQLARSAYIGRSRPAAWLSGAYRAKQIGDPHAVLLELRAHGMWLSDAVIQRTLQLAGLIA